MNAKRRPLFYLGLIQLFQFIFTATGFATESAERALEGTENAVVPADPAGPAKIRDHHVRANEVISMSVDYLNSVANELDLLGSEQESGKRELLGAFCLPSEGTPVCERRFRWYLAKSLSEARKAIALNDEAAHRLEQGEKNPVARQVPLEKGAKADGRKVVLTYVPQFKSLQAQYDDPKTAEMAQRAYQDYVNGRDYVGELKKEFRPRPEPHEFIKMVAVPANAKDPKGEKRWIPARDSQGQIVLDAEAYQKAVAAYEADQVKEISIAPGSKEFEKHWEKRKAQSLDDLRAIRESRKSLSRSEASRESKARIERHRIAYDKAHDNAVEGIAQRLNGTTDQKVEAHRAAIDTPIGSPPVSQDKTKDQGQGVPLGEKKLVPKNPDKAVPVVYSAETVEQIRSRVLGEKKTKKP